MAGLHVLLFVVVSSQTKLKMSCLPQNSMCNTLVKAGSTDVHVLLLLLRRLCPHEWLYGTVDKQHPRAIVGSIAVDKTRLPLYPLVHAPTHRPARLGSLVTSCFHIQLGCLAVAASAGLACSCFMRRLLPVSVFAPHHQRGYSTQPDRACRTHQQDVKRGPCRCPGMQLRP